MNRIMHRSDTPWSLDALPRLDQKTILITGANSGIGFEAARVFARAGAYVVLACRSRKSASEAIDRICAEVPKAAISSLELDLANLASVRACAKEAAERLPRIDILCNNAGVMNLSYGKTSDGFEMHFGINHLGHFALTGLLFETLVASAPSRIVTVSSWSHRSGTMQFDDLQWEHTPYDKSRAYGQSKLANILFTYEMGRRLRARGLDVKAVACHPGLADTNLHLDRATMKRSWFIRYAGPLMGQSAAMGAFPEIYAAVGADIQSGDYIGPSGFMGARGLPKKVCSNERSHDVEVAKRLWDESSALTGVRFLE